MVMKDAKGSNKSTNVVVGKCRIPGRNENGNSLVERELFLANSF